MSDSEDTSPQNEARPTSQNIPRVLEIPSLKHEHDLSTPEVKSDDSIASEAPSKDPEFEMLNPADFDDGESVPLTKSGASSLGSFTEVESLPQSPGVEMTMEHSDMKKLLHEAGRESGESSNETEEHTPPPEVDIDKGSDKQSDCVETVLEDKDASLNNENDVLSETETKLDDNVVSETVSKTDQGFSASEDRPDNNLGVSGRKSEKLEQSEPDSSSGHDLDTSDRKQGEKVDNNTLSDFSKVSEDNDVTLFSSITYLGSSTVNAPVSDTELKRTMALLKQQSRVAIDIVVSVSASFNGAVKLLDPQSRTVIATYELQKILFCGRGDDDGGEEDCFAFNTCHGSADVFHCHVFRCLENGAAAKILTRFAQSFRNRQKLRTDSCLVYKFDLVFDILEDDGRGSLASVPRDKTCFKLRRDVHKQINIQLHQLSNRLLILERCFGLLICPGHNVTHSDMNLLDKVTMENADNGRTYIITGNWDPEREDTLVLNTETKKDFVVYMTVAVDFVVSGISEPVRFIKELGVKVYPSNERFWNPSRPKIKEQYTLELKLAQDEKENEKSYEVLSLQCSTQQEIKEILTSIQTDRVDDDDVEDDDDEEPLMSGSGQPVAREFSGVQLDNWSVIMTKWKDVNSRPKQVKTLIRKQVVISQSAAVKLSDYNFISVACEKSASSLTLPNSAGFLQGVPEPLRTKVWQMLVGLDDSNYLVESYKDLIRRESPNEQVIQWDIYRTFPGHEYFRSSEGEGQENLQKICRAYSVYDDEVGYCQGMSHLAAVLLLHLPEEQAFGVFVKIMYDYCHRELFLNGFEKLNERFFVLERITEEFLPDLHSHFLKNNVELHMFCSQWFLTLFTAKFPLSLVYRIMDLYLSEGQQSIYQFATALLKVAKKDLLQLSFEGMLKYFRVSLPRRFISEEEQNTFMNVILSYKTVVRKLKRYEELYELKKEREKENEDPVERLQRENKQLMLANIRFEQENDALAYELVTTKVSLRAKLDEAEEHAEDYLRELEVLQKKVPELQDENEKFRAEGTHVKDLLRKNAEENEAMRQRYESVIEEYKKICSQLDERTEQLKSNLEKELREIKRRIGSCTNCSRLITGDGEALPGNTFKPSVKIEDADQRKKELELELAQTKLSLVEAECNVQDLEHRLSSFMSAVAAEESKPWFRRSKLGTPSKK